MILPGRPYRAEAIFHTPESNDLIVDDGVVGTDRMLFASYTTSGGDAGFPLRIHDVCPGC